MARLLDRFRGPTEETRSGFVELYETWRGAPTESPLTDFVSYTEQGYKSNGVVFACILARMMLLSEVEFKYRNLGTERLFGTPTLGILERPWPNGTTGEMIARMEQDGSIAGNAYLYQPIPGQPPLQRLRPDWVQIVTDGSQLVGYVYTVPGGTPKVLLPEEVVHWSPIPDPTAQFRGMSWLQPVATEILADSEMTRHKRAFLRNAATPNAVVTVEGKPPQPVKDSIKEALRLRHTGPENAYRTLLLEGGADFKVVGMNMRQLEFAVTQAAGENRIATAAGVPAIVAGFKEGLQASTYSNYQQAMRRFGDHTIRPLWRTLCAALETVAPPPPGAKLWYDAAHIAALRQDETDLADIKSKNAQTVRTFIDAGFEPDSAVLAVTEDDLTQLQHTGLAPVQVQLPAAGQAALPAGDDDDDDQEDGDDG